MKKKFTPKVATHVIKNLIEKVKIYASIKGYILDAKLTSKRK